MNDRQCLPVIIGAGQDGRMQLPAIEAGLRESQISWAQLMLDFKGRGLREGTKSAIEDGTLGFWKTLIQT